MPSSSPTRSRPSPRRPIAKDAGIDKVGFIVIDVPAATGPITAIATPIYEKADVELDMIPISPQVADMTPQIQQAISSGDGQFSVTGTDEFNANAIKALKQLGFNGPIIAGVSTPTRRSPRASPAGSRASPTLVGHRRPDRPGRPALQRGDRQVRARDRHGRRAPPTATWSPWAFVRALTGATAAVDAPSIMTALSSMPSPVPLPLGAGITFQCGSKPVALTPNVCTSQVLVDPRRRGQGHDYEVVDVSQLIPELRARSATCSPPRRALLSRTST